MAAILSWIEGLMQTAREDYGVNPIVFLVIYLACVPVFYYSLFRTLRALARRRGRELLLWSAVFLGANAAPFLYVLLFGRNIPWWVYLVFAVLIGQGVLSLVLKLRRRPAGDA
ncbi:MAG: hypothetical protein JW900_05150 [Anaerolineae bacterium]|nr:hypothetical protein [Anaerolineae bacterium]